MFEDQTADGFEVDREGSDREILFSIWLGREVGDFPVDEAWGVLAERYPEDLRFLLLNTFEEMLSRAEFATPDYLLRKATRLAEKGGAPLREPVADLLSIYRAQYRKDLRGEAAERFDALARGFDDARRDEDEAIERLEAVERRVLEECHDRTLGNRPLVKRAPLAAAATADFERLEAASKDAPEKPYSASAIFRAGDRVKHPVFGVGLVLSTREGRVEILFSDKKRLLACKPGRPA